MYVIIVGGGRIGYYLAKALLDASHEVLIIEKDAANCENINSEMAGMCIRGDGCEVPILTEAGTARADVFVAVTGEDEDNLISCQVAKHRFHVPRTIARVRNPQNEPVFKKLGIDFTINATQIILDRITEGVHPDTSLK